MKAQQFLAVTLHTVILSLFYFIDQASTQQIGRGCQMNDIKRSPGVQRLLTDCPAAISNLRSGIDPTITYRSNSAVLICCPSQKRISAIKCSEYSHVFIDRPIRPLLPTEALSRVTTQAPRLLRCDSKAVSFIVGGRDANLREFPYMAAIGYGPNGNSGYKCGGTLISERYVISAAHCVTSSNQPTTVVLGDIRLGPNEASVDRTVVGIRNIIIHPDRKLPFKYSDLVLFELDRPVKVSKAIHPACLPQPEDRLENFSAMTTAGWGYIEGYAGLGSDILQAVNLTRFSQSNCENIFNQKVNEKKLKYPKGILRSQFCAGDPLGTLGTKDTCNGDSGGGITVKKNSQECMAYIIGLTSFGSQACSGGEPGIYTNVQSYLDWIEATVWPGL